MSQPNEPISDNFGYRDRRRHNGNQETLKSERRFSAEKMQKVNLFETERMFADIYCPSRVRSRGVHAHSGAERFYW